MAENDDTKLENQDTTGVDGQAQDETVESQESESTETTTEGVQTGDEAADALAKFEKRFTQFKGDTPEEYAKNLEEGYDNSSKEAIRLKKRLDAVLAEKLSDVANSDSGKTDAGEGKQESKSLTDIWAEQEMKRRHVDQYNAFASKHPEVNQDDDLFQRLDEETGRYMNYVLSVDKRVPDLGEALEFAWARISPDDGSSKDEKVASAVKNASSETKSKTAAKDPKRPVFTDKQIEAAKRIDPRLREKSRTEIEELLSKYTN